MRSAPFFFIIGNIFFCCLINVFDFYNALNVLIFFVRFHRLRNHESDDPDFDRMFLPVFINKSAWEDEIWREVMPVVFGIHHDHHNRHWH